MLQILRGSKKGDRAVKTLDLATYRGGVSNEIALCLDWILQLNLEKSS